MASFTKGKTVTQIHDILMNLFLPHIGELNYKRKALFLGYIVFRLLKVKSGEAKPTDRDSFSFKKLKLLVCCYINYSENIILYNNITFF